jgi:lysophospholipase L1-like esterase
MEDRRRAVHRQGSRFDGVFFHIGYGVVCLTFLALAIEAASTVVVGVYHGSYLRLSVVAPTLGYHDVTPRFSLRNMLGSDLLAASHVYDTEPWGPEFLKADREPAVEWGHRYEPFREWGNSEVHGRYINIDEGVGGAWRRTVNNCRRRTDRRLTIWVFGGSTVAGMHVPDAATIPSYLSEVLNADDGGACVDVMNLGVIGYVTNQETILLTALLKAGHRPDVVVFYDGANDAGTGAYSPGIASAHADLFDIKRRVEHSVNVSGIADRSYAVRAARAALAHLIGGVPVFARNGGHVAPPYGSEQTLRRQVQETLDNYEANLALVEVLGRAYGFRRYYFWQPILSYGSKRQTAFEHAYLSLPQYNDPDEYRATVAVYREAERRAALHGRFTFLGHVFDGVGDPVYLDTVHLGPGGNRAIAAAIARVLSAGSATAAATLN